MIGSEEANKLSITGAAEREQYERERSPKQPGTRFLSQGGYTQPGDASSQKPDIPGEEWTPAHQGRIFSAEIIKTDIHFKFFEKLTEER